MASGDHQPVSLDKYKILANWSIVPPYFFLLALAVIRHLELFNSIRCLNIDLQPVRVGHWVRTAAADVQPHLEGLDEGPQQRPDTLPPAEQLDQSHHPEQAKEGDGDASAVLRVLEVVESEERWS